MNLGKAIKSHKLAIKTIKPSKALHISIPQIRPYVDGMAYPAKKM